MPWSIRAAYEIITWLKWLQNVPRILTWRDKECEFYSDFDCSHRTQKLQHATWNYVCFLTEIQTSCRTLLGKLSTSQKRISFEIDAWRSKVSNWQDNWQYWEADCTIEIWNREKIVVVSQVWGKFDYSSISSWSIQAALWQPFICINFCIISQNPSIA